MITRLMILEMEKCHHKNVDKASLGLNMHWSGEIEIWDLKKLIISTWKIIYINEIIAA